MRRRDIAVGEAYAVRPRTRDRLPARVVVTASSSARAVSAGRSSAHRMRAASAFALSRVRRSGFAATPRA